MHKEREWITDSSTSLLGCQWVVNNVSCLLRKKQILFRADLSLRATKVKARCVSSLSCTISCSVELIRLTNKYYFHPSEEVSFKLGLRLREQEAETVHLWEQYMSQSVSSFRLLILE